MIATLPNPLNTILVPRLLSPSRFGDLLKCKLSVLAPRDVADPLPISPVALLGTVLHHTVTEVGEGRWGESQTADKAFDAILAGAVAALNPQPVSLPISVGHQRWFTRVARARSWALADAPTTGNGVTRLPHASPGPDEVMSEARVDIGNEAWIVWPSGRLRGRADRVETYDGGIRVVENKSGSIRDRRGALIDSIGLQVGLYALAIEAITHANVETIVRGDEVVAVPWDANRRRSLRELLDRILAELPENASLRAEALTSPGPDCRGCRLRPACPGYLAHASQLWLNEGTGGRMPFDVWGELRGVYEERDGVRTELRDDAGRFVVVGGLSPDWGVQDLKHGDRLYFFDLEADEDRQHTERVQPSNFREAAPNNSSNRRRAFGLRIFRDQREG